MKLNHKQKRIIARKMITRRELKSRRALFQSDEWEERRRAKAAKIFKQRNRELVNN